MVLPVDAVTVAAGVELEATTAAAADGVPADGSWLPRGRGRVGLVLVREEIGSLAARAAPRLAGPDFFALGIRKTRSLEWETLATGK